MMTIKDMQKLFKKINKAEKVLNDGVYAIQCNTLDFETYALNAKDIVKAYKKLERIANSIALPTEDITCFECSDDFVRFCVMHNVDFVAGAEIEDDEVEETDDET